MASTYSGDPSSSQKDHVRFLLSDNKTEEAADNVVSPKFSDEEIQFKIDERGGVYSAASELASIMSGRYADKADKSVGPLSINYQSLSDRWWQLSVSLTQRGSHSSGAKAILTQKSQNKLGFEIGMHDIHIHTLSDQLNGEAPL
jgi:hypothetical protein